MKKRVIIGVCLCIAILAAAGVAWRQYAYWHPRQNIHTIYSYHVEYPEIVYQPYKGPGFDIPPVLWEQMTEFNQDVGAFALDMRLKYGDSLELGYELDYGKHGTTVIFNGQGTQADGTVTDIHKELHFDIVIREDAKWN